jgi:hypothetical protein
MIRHLGLLSDIDALSLLHAWDNQDVLDVGCGPGHLSRALAERGARVRGFEPDPVQAAKNAAAPPTERAQFAQAPAQALPVADGSADVVILSRSLHHVPHEHMGSALAEAKRALHPAGTLMVLEPDIHGQFSQLIRPFHDETLVRAQALEALAAAAPLFARMEEWWYTTEARFESFAAFKAHMIGMSFNDIVAERIEQPEVAAAFEAGREGEGYRFTNPTRVRVFSRS